ncbi:MAG: hypothetical protein [Microvirus sp.]|nr:MAG: hypothetical protein [Microvirus sp.]
MKYRRPANGRSDKRSFTRNAMRIHRKNISNRPMRGGIRM